MIYARFPGCSQHIDRRMNVMVDITVRIGDRRRHAGNCRQVIHRIETSRLHDAAQSFLIAQIRLDPAASPASDHFLQMSRFRSGE